MSDDQDGCEWVNVSSDTGPPIQVVPDKVPTSPAGTLRSVVEYGLPLPFNRRRRRRPLSGMRAYESAPIQLAQCRLPGLAISNAKISIYFHVYIYTHTHTRLTALFSGLPG